jgi:hypothetical protein
MDYVKIFFCSNHSIQINTINQTTKKVVIMWLFRASGIGKDSTPFGVHLDAIVAIHRNYNKYSN